MKRLQLFQVSSLYKAFIDSEDIPASIEELSCLKGEEVSYQIVCRPCYMLECEDASSFYAKIAVESELQDYITVRQVGNVPVELAAYTNRPKGVDEDYERTTSGLYPDPLYNLQGSATRISPTFHNTKAFWVSVKTTEACKAGVYPITVHFTNEELGVDERVTMSLEIIDAALPKQELIVTQWLHADCIATYYNEKVFSSRHWELIESFIKTATDNGINMILTPIFTPPLDAEVGGERPTVQLVDIACKDGIYTFEFEKLDKWVDICKRNNVQYYEMAHLFSQWGAKFAPKVVVLENGEYIKKFGWHTSATADGYPEFLQQFLPALTAHLEELGIAKQTYFHVSDEPNMANMESYSAARNIVLPLLKNYPIVDAMSHYEFLESAVVDKPIVGIYRIENFVEHNVQDLWVYYCCDHVFEVSNRLMAMSSARNRIIGLQMYKYDIEGFLHWGYNFYYTQLSRSAVNPFTVTDAGNAFPAGDAFSVYPGEEKPIESLRLKVFKEALQDMRALRYLENFMSKEEIIKLMEDEAGMEITFREYPKGEAFLLNLRRKINNLIKGKTK